MNSHEFRKEGHRLVDWMADYLDNLRDLPVRSTVAPGEIINELPIAPPITAEPFDKIFSDFQQKIMPGMTHWQHPSFFAYFPANSSAPSVLAEMLTATLGAQCMIWQTSPAAAEILAPGPWPLFLHLCPTSPIVFRQPTNHRAH